VILQWIGSHVQPARGLSGQSVPSAAGKACTFELETSSTVPLMFIRVITRLALGTISTGIPMSTIKDLLGKRFGRLYVLHFAGLRRRSDGRFLATWHCACDCGNLKTVTGKDLLSKKTLSCGCLGLERRRAALTKHGESFKENQTVEYRCWRNMLQRCEDPKNKCFKNYGGRGITVCRKWHTYSVFLSDMGRCPTGRTINRADNDGPYQKSNCFWSTVLEQANNTSRTRFIRIGGVKKSAALWARQFRVPVNSVYSRLKRGLDGMEAIRGKI